MGARRQEEEEEEEEDNNAEHAESAEKKEKKEKQLGLAAQTSSKSMPRQSRHIRDDTNRRSIGMSRARLWTTLTLAGLVGLCWSGLAMAQETPTPPAPPAGGDTAQRGNRQRPTAEEMRQRMEEYRKRAADQLRQSLGASEDEWKVLQPLIEKVQGLQRSSRGGMMRAGIGGFGGMGGFGNFGGRTRGTRGARDANTSAAATPPAPPAPTNPDGTPRELTAVEKQTTALNDVLKNKDASPTQITEALTALRTARAKGLQELTQAREELKKVVTAQQEAMLVLMGLLE
jgi:hypothetical protein